MKRIDPQTVQRILDATDIVEVVSDFVHLKKRGSNYLGLCPFHNERTPSFAVSKVKGIFKCFSCGKAGSAVSFVMEHEHMTYAEALRYLAKKYHIEIQERELTPQEREQATERESLIAVNDFAMKHFEENLTQTADGRDIGLAYFRERGINDLMIRKFHLGYALEKNDDLLKTALAKGFSEKYLISTGLCAQGERGIYDRFRGRVIYPVFSVSGRVVAFGGRTLRKDKSVAKYVNSPESAIYRKSYELYGLYQAKNAISKQDKCILVEGYMDVISMHQVGIENVVASSGTSLTEGQIRLIHRFTNNVTVIYDSDPAGIKASLRGIDMLLAEGMDIKVLLLPDGDDPDSFAQSHSSAEVEDYIARNETDFIRFKTRILLRDTGDDPIARAKVITDIVGSIAVVPDPIRRTIYIQECSRMLNIDEKVLTLQVDKQTSNNLEKRREAAGREAAGREAARQTLVDGDGQPAGDTPAADVAIAVEVKKPSVPAKPTVGEKRMVHERELIKFVVRYGMMPIALSLDAEEAGSTKKDVNVVEYLDADLGGDGVRFTTPLFARLFDMARSIAASRWPADRDAMAQGLAELRTRLLAEGRERIRQEGGGLDVMEMKEKKLAADVDAAIAAKEEDYAADYLQQIFLSIDDDEIRSVSADLIADKHTLSKVHTKYAHVPTERELLPERVQRGCYELKYAILEQEIADIVAQMGAVASDPHAQAELFRRLGELQAIRSQFAKALGDRTLAPK